VKSALNELIKARKVVVDQGTEELLVRAFIRSDNGYGNEKRRPAILKAAQGILSSSLRGVVAQEMRRLGLTIMADQVAPDTASDVPSLPPVDGPSDRASDGPSDGASSTEGVVGTYVSREVTTTHNPETATRNPGSSTQEPGAASHAMPPPDVCKNHPAGTDQPCSACGRARLARTEWDASQTAAVEAARVEARRHERAERAAAIEACDLCSTNGYRLIEGTTRTGAVCNHQPLNPGGRARALAALAQEPS
jgi:hypothetical protein